MFSYARAETEAGGEALLLTADRDLYGAVERAHRGRRAAQRRRASPARSGPSRCASATASSPSRCPTSSRCAATPPTACPARPGIGAKTAAELLRATERSRTCSRAADIRATGACARAPPPRCCDNAELLRTFKRDRHAAAHRRRSAPPDRATDFARGAARRRRARACNAWRASALAESSLRRELDGDHVAVIHHVVAALQAQRPALARAGVAARRRPARASRSLRRARSPSGCRCGSDRRRATR